MSDLSKAWSDLYLDYWRLSSEAATVMMLRMERIAGGGATGAAEAELMVIEKVRATIDLQRKLMTGALGSTPLSGSQDRAALSAQGGGQPPTVEPCEVKSNPCGKKR